MTFVPGTPSVLSIRTIEQTDAFRALSFAQEHELPALVYSCINRLGHPIETVYSRAGSAWKPERDINGMPIVYVDDWERVDLSGTVAILLERRTGPSKGELRQLQEAIGSSVQVTASGGPYFELTHAAVSKGAALIRLMSEFGALGARYEAWRRFTHLELASTMAIGDNFKT